MPHQLGVVQLGPHFDPLALQGRREKSLSLSWWSMSNNGRDTARSLQGIGLACNPPALQDLRSRQELLLERLIAAIEHDYDEAHESLARSPEQRRAEIVQRLLAEEPVEFAELAELKYEFHSVWHLGMIATGTGAQEVLSRVKTDLGCMLLQVSGGNGTVWAWLGASRKIKAADVERLSSASQVAWESLAIGGLGKGLDGWRRTHREAMGALPRALGGPEKVVRYVDAPLLAAALENDTLAAWLREFLNPLRSRPDGGVGLRQTLRAYIDAECNRSSAASMLKVRRQTVTSRLGIAEQLLGRQLRTCLAELDIALQLLDLVPDDASSTT